MKIIDRINNHLIKKKWRIANKHNYTTISFEVDFSKLIVGKYTYGELTVYNSETSSKVIIGNYCSIGPKVVFLVGSEHELHCLSTYPFEAMVLNANNKSKSKGDIIVDDDVWIGYGAIILSGIHIGQGAVVAAGAVVTKDVPPYAVVGGNPAKVIEYRFPPDIVDYMENLDYSKLSKESIESHIALLNEELPTDSLVDIRNNFDWFPKHSCVSKHI